MAEKEKRGVEARGRMEWTANCKAGVEIIAEGKFRGAKRKRRKHRASLSQRNLQCSPANLSVDGDVTFDPPPPPSTTPNRK